MNQYHFQFCPKLIVLSADGHRVLLAKRFGEKDYDGTFSFIGGKMERSDADIVAAITREKNEEIGPDVRLRFFAGLARNLLFVKHDGTPMVLPHYVCQYVGGDIELNQSEYSEYKWFSDAELAGLQAKIANIPSLVEWARQCLNSDILGEVIEV